MNKHTPEPWRVSASGSICTVANQRGEYTTIAIPSESLFVDDHAANMQRIVACVNACAEMINPEAEIRRLRELVIYYSNLASIEGR